MIGYHDRFRVDLEPDEDDWNVYMLRCAGMKPARILKLSPFQTTNEVQAALDRCKAKDGPHLERIRQMTVDRLEMALAWLHPVLDPELRGERDLDPQLLRIWVDAASSIARLYGLESLRVDQTIKVTTESPLERVREKLDELAERRHRALEASTE